MRYVQLEFEAELENLMATLSTSDLDAEAERFSPGTVNQARVVRAQQIILPAMQQGVTDKNRLTDVIFVDRHPERRGRPLKNNERTLRNEWMGIRDGLVQPMLVVWLLIRRGVTNENQLTDGAFFDRYPGRKQSLLKKNEWVLRREWIQIRDLIVRPLLAMTRQSSGPVQPTRPAPSTPFPPRPGPSQPQSTHPPVQQPRPPVPPVSSDDPWQPWVDVGRHPDTLPPGAFPTDSGDQSWVWSALKSAAKVLGVGVVVTAGLSAVPEGALAAALEQAWIAFQTTEGSLAARYGAAGEAAARAFVAWQLGDPALVIDLNEILKDFPVVDFISPNEIPSVKVRFLASALSEDARAAAARSAYAGDLLDLLGGGSSGDKKLEKAATKLWENRKGFARSWPARLKSREDVLRYLRFEAPIYIPSDHVQLLRKTRGGDLLRRISRNAPLQQKIGVKTQAQMAKFIQNQVFRYKPLPLKSVDFQIMAKTAAEYLPPDQVERMRRDLERIRARRGP